MITAEIAARYASKCGLAAMQMRRQPYGCRICVEAYLIGVKICEAAHWSATHGPDVALRNIGDDPRNPAGMARLKEIQHGQS
jgi:hypothetical protein